MTKLRTTINRLLFSINYDWAVCRYAECCHAECRGAKYDVRVKKACCDKGHSDVTTSVSDSCKNQCLMIFLQLSLSLLLSQVTTGKEVFLEGKKAQYN
jgi:hypothetical protein